MSGPILPSRWRLSRQPREDYPVRAARWQRSHRPRTAVLLGLIALGFILGLAWLVVGQYQSSSGQHALSELRAQAERNQQYDALLVRVLEAESAVRGYRLVQDPTLLTPLQQGRAAVQDALIALRADARRRGADEAALDALETAINARWERLAFVAAMSDQPTAGYPAYPTGTELTEGIRQQIAALRAATTHEIDASLAQWFDRFSQARDRNLALGLGVLVLLALLVAMGLREERLRRSLAEMLHSENERLHLQVSARTAELNDLASYLTNARELEQERLARELHDELGSLLTAAKLDASWIARKLSPEAMEPLKSRFDRLFETLSQVIALKRKVVADLRPPLLSDLGLTEALRSMADQGGVGDYEGELRLDLMEDLPPLSPEVSLALYRIAQEALTNVRRYAKATEVDIKLQVEGDELVLVIRDNGIGFDASRRHSNRHGLVGMAHRMQMLEGVLDVSSTPGQGTTVCASVHRSRWI